MPGPALAVVGRSQQPINQPLVGAIGHDPATNSAICLGRRRQAGQIERQAAKQRAAIHRRGEYERWCISSLLKTKVSIGLRPHKASSRQNTGAWVSPRSARPTNRSPPVAGWSWRGVGRSDSHPRSLRAAIGTPQRQLFSDGGQRLFRRHFPCRHAHATKGSLPGCRKQSPGRSPLRRSPFPVGSGQVRLSGFSIRSDIQSTAKRKAGRSRRIELDASFLGRARRPIKATAIAAIKPIEIANGRRLITWRAAKSGYRNKRDDSRSHECNRRLGESEASHTPQPADNTAGARSPVRECNDHLERPDVPGPLLVPPPKGVP